MFIMNATLMISLKHSMSLDSSSSLWCALAALMGLDESTKLSISVCNELSDNKVKHVTFVNCTFCLASFGCLYFSGSIIRMVNVTVDLG